MPQPLVNVRIKKRVEAKGYNTNTGNPVTAVLMPNDSFNAIKHGDEYQILAINRVYFLSPEDVEEQVSTTTSLFQAFAGVVIVAGVVGTIFYIALHPNIFSSKSSKSLP